MAVIAEITDRPLVVVDWIDTTAVKGDWMSAEQALHDVDESLVQPCRSVGFVLRDDQVGLVLCCSYSRFSGNVSDVLFIPASLITGRVEIQG